MKKIIVLLVMAVMAFGVELTVDKRASSIGFETTKMFFVGVDGSFSDFSGTITVEGGKVTAINGLVAVLSLDTDNEKRDDHLLSSDFFHEVAFKSIVFRSTEVTDDTVVADITIKDITKTVTFAMEKIDVSDSGAKVKLTAVVDRTEFDIDNNFMSMIIFNNIDITSTLIAK
ncbi:MAG: YceI family protein [Campylobacterota bacterium]